MPPLAPPRRFWVPPDQTQPVGPVGWRGSGTLPVGANPTAQVSGTAVNGVAATYMRSDAAPRLANTAVAAGSYMLASLTVDAQGRLTAASSGTVALTGDVTGSGGASVPTTLASVNSSIGTFQGLTINAKGLVTAAVNQNYLTATTGVASFNTRVGAVTLSSGDVTGALGFTPYNATNPSGYQTAAQVNTALGPYAPLASPVFSGAPSLPTGSIGVTQAAANSTTALATTAYVKSQNYAPLASPAFTGAPTVAGNIAVTGQVESLGSVAGVIFADRSTALQWQWYASGGPASLYNPTTGPVMAISVAGVCQNISGTWSAISDRRLKEGIAPYIRGLDAVLQLAPVTFRYNGKGGLPADGTTHYGLIADDVAPILPELVGERELEGEVFKTVDPGRAIYALINAVKELAAQNAALEARIAALEAKA
jgi:hypothetical protein